MTIAEVRLWGRTIGAVSWDDDQGLGAFEYAREFIPSGIDVAPLMMPLSDRIYRFPALPRETFHGLPGLLADSLPDDFGNALINAWLEKQGRSPGSFNPVERLCYIGTRGMGALEFSPATGPDRRRGAAVDIDALVALASEVLSLREDLHGTLPGDSRAGLAPTEKELNDILRVGTSAGGARAKAVIAWNPQTNEVRSGQVDAGSGFQYWLLKLDGVSGNRDRELEDPKGYGKIEYAYYLMAQEAGMQMSECRLLAEKNRHHFMTRRFDRTESGDKLHMQTLGAMLHMDYRQPGSCSYEQALRTIRSLGLSMSSIEEQFRRMCFNIMARNQDDHIKNIAFLMDRRGQWYLAPAYDVTYSYNPDGAWTGTHQMTLNGKRDDFELADFRACASHIAMKKTRCEDIMDEVQAAVRKWPAFAEAAGVDEHTVKRIANSQRLGLL